MSDLAAEVWGKDLDLKSGFEIGISRLPVTPSPIQEPRNYGLVYLIVPPNWHLFIGRMNLDTTTLADILLVMNDVKEKVSAVDVRIDEYILFRQIGSYTADDAPLFTAMRRKFTHDEGDGAPYLELDGDFTPYDPLNSPFKIACKTRAQPAILHRGVYS